MHHQLIVLCSLCALLGCRGACCYKVHYLYLPALCGCMYPRWMKRKMKRSVVTARGEGLRNEKSTRAGPIFPYTHRNTHTRIHTHLLACLKVTCRRRWMCGLQPLKCPHEAKELFVSLEELQSPGWDWNRRLTPLSCFHHNRTMLLSPLRGNTAAE